MPARAFFLPTALLVAACGIAPAADDDWPRWRGPNDDGMARGDAPLEWSDSKNIAWRVKIPGLGNSSPVLWGGKIFLTTAVPTGAAPEAAAPAADRGPGGPPGGGPPGGGPPGGPGMQRGAGGPPPGGRGGARGSGGAGGGSGAGREYNFVVMCLDRKTGKVLWERVAKTATPHEGYHGKYGSFASNSPVTDGKRLYAFFGSRGIYCYDLEGKLIWEKQFPPMKMRMQFGEGTPTVIDDKAVYLKFDHQEGSFLVALDKLTGRELWKVDREEDSSWAPPLVVEHGGRRQLVVPATKRVRSYDPATGKLIWECGGLGANAIPAPIARDGMVWVMTGYRDPNMLAIKLGREGDLTGTDAVAWTNNRGNPYTPSPVLHEGKLYFVSDNATLSCLNALTGQPYYSQQRLPKPASIKASPVGANGKLYISTEDGDVVVVRMGEKFEVLATNSLEGHMFIATPAVGNGEMFLRSTTTLFAVRK